MVQIFRQTVHFITSLLLHYSFGPNPVQAIPEAV